MSFIDLTQDLGPNTEPMLAQLGDEALPIGFLLGGCQIIEPISTDGTSILYLANDAALQRDVLIREHFPAKLVCRDNQSTVVLREGADPKVRASVLENFLQEGRWLVRLDHPHIAKLHRFWEQNQTAYMMMPFYQGESLASALLRSTEPVTESWLKQLLSGVLAALHVLHELGCYHLALSPERIWLTPEGQPMLLDLSESNKVVGAQLYQLDSVDRSYAPIEQFSHGAGFHVGPWTDLYAMAAVAHQAILGRPPTSAAILDVNDQLVPLSEALLSKGSRWTAQAYSPVFLSLIDRALSVQPTQRPQSVAEFEQALKACTPEQERSVSGEVLPDQLGPDGLSQSADADPAAKAAIAMAISSLPWVTAEKKPAPAFAPAPPAALQPTPQFDDQVTIPAPHLFKAPKTTQSPDQAFHSVPALPPRPMPPAAPPRSVPVAAAAQVEPVFKPTHTQASTLEDQWIGPAAMQASVNPRTNASLPAKRSRTGLWLALGGVVLSGVGLGWYVSHHADFPYVSASWSKVTAPQPPAPAVVVAQPPVSTASQTAAASSVGLVASQAMPVSQPASITAASAIPSEPGKATSIATKVSPVVVKSTPVVTVSSKKAAVVGAAAGAAPKSPSIKGKTMHATTEKKTPKSEIERPPVGASPRANCSGKGNFSLVYCMQTQCSRPAFSHHPQCVAFRIDGEVR
jgi:serine/threonine protein kinase